MIKVFWDANEDIRIQKWPKEQNILSFYHQKNTTPDHTLKKLIIKCFIHALAEIRQKYWLQQPKRFGYVYSYVLQLGQFTQNQSMTCLQKDFCCAFANLLLDKKFQNISYRTMLNNLRWQGQFSTRFGVMLSEVMRWLNFLQPKEFIVNLASWMGGLYERLVGVTDRALRIGSRCFTEKHLVTVLTEAETVVNSWPLIYVDDDINSSFAITPLNFLSQSYQHFIPEFKIDSDTFEPTEKISTSQCLLQRWKRVVKDA